MIAISNRIDIDIDRQQVLHNIGYADCKPPPRIDSLIDEYAEHAHHLIDPSYSYIIRDIERVWGYSVCIDGSIIFESQVIAELLVQCHKVAVFLVTIGKHLEEMVCHLAEDRLVLQAIVLDAIGSGVTEKVADFVQDRIAELASAEGLCTSQRFSPGYCDWGMDQQKMVFRAMNDDYGEIRLTEGCLMLPQKSVSAIIGIGPCNSNLANYNPCKTCVRRHYCHSRR